VILIGNYHKQYYFPRFVLFEQCTNHCKHIPEFWKLQFKLKWELEISSDKKMEPLKMALTNAFNKLEYDNPELEANLIILFIDGIGSAVLKGSELNAEEMMHFLIKKYNL